MPDCDGATETARSGEHLVHVADGHGSGHLKHLAQQWRSHGPPSPAKA
jgi:hypothetical protein